METSTTSLYDILGGHDTMQIVVDDFYQRMLNDERINHYFEHLDMTKLKEHQIAFVSQILGGPEQYSGRSMAEAHAGLDLSSADFDVTAQHLVAALEKVRVSQIHIDEVISKIAKLEREIIHK